MSLFGVFTENADGFYAREAYWPIKPRATHSIWLDLLDPRYRFFLDDYTIHHEGMVLYAKVALS